MTQVGTICRALIICESKPDVNSIPIHVGNRRKYKNRRFGFLYHLTLSSFASLVTMGSESAPVSPFFVGINPTIFTDVTVHSVEGLGAMYSET